MKQNKHPNNLHIVRSIFYSLAVENMKRITTAATTAKNRRSIANNMRCTMAHTEREFGRGEKSGVERTLLEYYYSNYVFMASLSDLYETFIVRYLPIPPTFIHAFFFVCAVLVCRFRYLYLLHRWNVHREIGFWCANAIKMEANQSNKKEKKLRLLYRHDLLFLGLNPHLYRIVLTFARLLCVVDVFSFHSLSLFCQVLFG